LIVDWSQLAYAQTNAAKNAEAVGNRVAQMITQAHLMTSRVNLIGFSMGGTVVNRIAADLKTRHTQVNRIVSIDVDVGRYEPSVFASDSSYSIAFGGNDHYAGEVGTATSDDAVLFTGLSARDTFRHAQVFDIVTAMWQRDAGTLAGSDDISPIFSINNILNGLPVNWRKNSYGNGYEAEMNCGNQPGFPNDLGPTSLTFVNLHRHTAVVT
jgi:pimeloyl-ACP methyl ester carboxylesterase